MKLSKNKWKGIKWIDTRFARRYKNKKAIAIAAVVSVAAAGIANINAGAFSIGMPSHLLLQMKAIVEINKMKSIARILKEPDKRWRA